jgi:ABC-type Zn uptake system ZnuABC Zn-binding protein ZnuA
MSRLPVLLALAALAGGCGSAAVARSGRPVVVATTTQLADIARNVAGRHAEVVQILAPNTDPHEYEVRPGDVKALEGARLVLRSGGDVDDWLKSAIDASGTHAPVVTLIDHVRRSGDDPHWWQDPRDVEQAVLAIDAALAKVDGPHAAAYGANAAAYEARLRRLDRAVAACWRAVPPARREIVTTHDALGYYARRYGVRVVGTVIPSLSSEAQPSAGDTARLVADIRRAGVKAVFVESSMSPKLGEAIARQTGARVGGALWADTLGPAGSAGATYLSSIAANTEALTAGAGRRCRP